MEYEGQICRAPQERAFYMLPVTVGCSYNACRFCMLFKHLKYRELPLEQVEAELRRVKDAGGNPKQVFFGDGSAFTMSAQRLLTILEMVHHYFPACHTVHMDATVTNIAKKTDEELKALADAGVKCLFLGIESGLDDVLRFMCKDHNMAQAEEQILRLKKVGIGYAAHIMTGVAGQGRGLENAEALADFFNRTQPESICNFSMFLHRGSPLYSSIQDGTFVPADELECFREERRLIELLDVPELSYEGLHEFIILRVRGKLPRDREKLLAALDKTIAQCQDKEPVYAYVH